jgi:hypothetical protein
MNAICDDCTGSGQCALASALSKNSVPLRGGHSLPNGLSFNSNLMENRQPFRPHTPNTHKDTPKELITQNIEHLNNGINPYADFKLKHKTCPFHRLKSLGFGFITIFPFISIIINVFS